METNKLVNSKCQRVCNVLYLEDNSRDAELVAFELSDTLQPFELVWVRSAPEFEAALHSQQFDIILSDYSVPGYSGSASLALARQLQPHAPFIFVSGTVPETRTVELYRSGASDCVLKGQLGRLSSAIKRALAESAAHRDRNRNDELALLDLMHDAVLVCNCEGQIQFWNEGAERLYGWSASEVLNKIVLHLLFNGKTDEWNEAIAMAQRTGRWHGEFSHATRNRAKISVEAHLTLLDSPAPQSAEFLLVLSDVTERKLLEKQFLRAQRMECIGVLAGGVAHELNNVLAPVLMAAQLLEEMELADEQRRMVATIRSSAMRGVDIVQQVLSFARGTDATRLTVKASNLVKDVVAVSRRTFPRSISIETSVPDDLWAVSCDPTQVHQVLFNLFVNARDAMPGGGTLRLEMHNVEIPPSRANTGRFVLFRVSDTGAGIPKDLLPRVFEPFFTTKEPGKGTGLGLSTVRGIIDSHDGFVEVFSTEGKGTTFSIFLPACAMPSVPVIERAPRSPASGRGELILIVDDEVAVAHLTQILLTAHGYRAVVANSPSQALHWLGHSVEPLGAVITDIEMPEMDGIQLASRIRSMRPACPIIAVSGKPLPSQYARTLPESVSRFLPKPWTMERLLELVREVLSTPVNPLAHPKADNLKTENHLCVSGAVQGNASELILS